MIGPRNVLRFRKLRIRINNTNNISVIDAKSEENNHKKEVKIIILI